jgi:hypothetical protein
MSENQFWSKDTCINVALIVVLAIVVLTILNKQEAFSSKATQRPTLKPALKPTQRPTPTPVPFLLSSSGVSWDKLVEESKKKLSYTKQQIDDFDNDINGYIKTTPLKRSKFFTLERCKQVAEYIFKLNIEIIKQLKEVNKNNRKHAVYINTFTDNLRTQNSKLYFTVAGAVCSQNLSVIVNYHFELKNNYNNKRI